jgi:hypothetical protein
LEKRHRRPLPVTLLIGGVFLLGAGFLLQSGQVLSRYTLYNRLPLSIPAWYLPAVGALWGGLWLILGIGLWRRKEWARRFTLVAIPLQAAFWLADWWLFSRSTIAIQSFAFDFILRLLMAGLATTILLLAGRWDLPGEISSQTQDPGRETRSSNVE